MKIVILDGYLLGFGGRSWEPISRHGALTYYDSTTAEDDVAARIGDAQAVFSNRCPISAQTLDRCPELRMIGSFGTGYNQIDLEAANRRGVTVCNTPAYGRGAVAQMAMALLFAIARNTAAFDHYVKQVGWVDPIDPALCAIPQIELTGKTIGIVGMGDIGYAVARIAMAMDMQVLAHRRTPDRSLENEQLRFVGLDTLLRESDIVSLHCPLTDETRGMMNREAFARMKNGAILLNTGRGAVVDEAAAAEALDSGKLYAVGADVFSADPCGRENPLALHPRCIATPHVAWTPAETRDRIIEVGGENLAAFLAGSQKNVVNAPIL